MESNAQAILLGLAVGDALGAPLEFMSSEQIMIKHGTVATMLGGGWLHLRQGQYTEDTTLALMLAEDLLENQDVVLASVVQRYLAWYRSNPQDITPILRAVLALLHEGKSSIDKVARRAYEELARETADNDLLPRSIPLAICYFADQKLLAQKTLQLAKLTHFDKKSISAAVALNLFIAHILRGESDREQIYHCVEQFLDDNELGIYNILPDVHSTTLQELRPSSRIQDTLQVALWMWMRKESFRDSMVTVINLGGDADTIGAVTGALAGGFYGREQIPTEWLKFLEDKNIIANVAKRLLKLANK